VSTTPPLVKICGLTRTEDVTHAVDAGADMIGFIMVDWSPRAVSVEQAARLRSAVTGSVAVVGVFCDADPAQISAAVERVGLDWVQLHGREPEAVIQQFAPRVINAYRLPTSQSLAGDVVLLDRRFDSTETTDALRAHWRDARRVAASRRVLLAGGLTPETVSEAVLTAAPWAVDAVRGTEASPGVKDPRLVDAFIRQAKEAA
jgi:phosphoribosylanthranilate isomerase